MMPEVGTHNDVEIIERVLTEKATGTLELAMRCKVGNAEIIAYQYLVAKDGTPSERTIRTLREATGWDGQLETICEGEWPLVQIVVEDEIYQERERRRVKWVNPNNSEGAGPLKGDDIKALAAKYGAKFRALAGGVPASKAPPKPATKADPKPKAAPKPAPKPPAEDESTLDECWKMLTDAFPGAEQAALEKQWFDTLTAAVPGKHQAGFDAADWGKVKAKIVADGTDAQPF